MIEANQLGRRYGEFVAVDDVSFRIEHGEIVGLLGHNGAGKTTIMKMLTGFIEPSSGCALVDGIDVQQQPLVVQANMGYLPESLPIYPELTVTDYLAHTAELRGVNPREAVSYAIAATQLGAKTSDRIDTLSRGYKQRLGVAQAILHKPKILILDEPSNGLDPNQIKEMRKLIQNLAQSATVILSTHIMQEVNAVCDRALILRNGRVIIDEHLATLKQTPRIRLKTSPDTNVENLIEAHKLLEVAESISPGEWVVTLAGEAQQGAAELARILSSQDVPIYHLAPEVRDLEAVFTEVNEMEDHDAV
jgi:ABC-2 type transport system ATP-binding protein